MLSAKGGTLVGTGGADGESRGEAYLGREVYRDILPLGSF